MTDEQAADVEVDKDFVQLKNGPFDIDLIFAADGIERFYDAWRRRIDVEGSLFAISTTSSPAKRLQIANAIESLCLG